MHKRPGLFFLCFIGFYYLVLLAYDLPDIVRGSSRFIQWPDDRHAIVLRLVDIGFSFAIAFCAYAILFRFYPRKQIVQALVLIILILPLLFLVRYWAEEILFSEANKRTAFYRPVRLRVYFSGKLFYSILYAVFGISFYFLRYAYYKELQQKDLEIQNRESELSFLRSQINPHFLFNNLNNIYSLVYHQSAHSLEVIAGFSDLLRYMLYDTLKDVPLEKEALYIQKYIDLQRIRYEFPINVDFKTSGKLDRVFIPPLLLIPFVENAFKHGEFTNGGEGISIVLDTSGQQTRFYCQNKIGSAKKDMTGGIGLQNVKRRLELLYPGKHALAITDGPVFFTIKLELRHV